MADAKKHIDNVSSGRKEEFDDIIKKIQKAAKKIKEDGDEQLNRLDDFENKNLKTDIANVIPDSDFLFLNKEVTRYRGSLQSLMSCKDNTLEDSIKIDFLLKKEEKKGESITPDDLHILRANLKALDK